MTGKKTAPLYSNNVLLVCGAGKAWEYYKNVTVFVASGNRQNASQVPALSYIIVNCRCSVSPNSMIICLFGDEVRFYFIALRPASSASRCRRLMTVHAKQTTPSAPCRLRTVIKVD